MANTIDITPSWSQAAEILILALENGTEDGKKIARTELRNMARVADLYVKSTESSSEKQSS